MTLLTGKRQSKKLLKKDHQIKVKISLKRSIITGLNNSVSRSTLLFSLFEEVTLYIGSHISFCYLHIAYKNSKFAASVVINTNLFILEAISYSLVK